MTTYEEVIPTLIQNTTVRKSYYDGKHCSYFITPIEGYVLHDQTRDWIDVDIDTQEESLNLGYTYGTATCAADYDFITNLREFYAVPSNTVPIEHIS